MGAIRRWYIYLVSAISLWALAWAAIWLLQGLLNPDPVGGTPARALQIALAAVSLPFYLVHWLWAQALARRDVEERAATSRKVFLWGMLASFVVPILANIVLVLRRAFELALAGPNAPPIYQASAEDSLRNAVVTVPILGLLWLYHWLMARADERAGGETANGAALHALYLLFFSGVGVFLTALGSARILTSLIEMTGLTNTPMPEVWVLGSAAAQALVGVVVWTAFWRAAARQRAAGTGEWLAVLHIAYLHVIVFVAVAGVLFSATYILDMLFSWLLGLTVYDVASAVAMLVVLGVLWILHARIWQGEAAGAGTAPRQAAVRRLYVYLVACLAFSLLLAGVAGAAHLLIVLALGEPWGRGEESLLPVVGAALLVAIPIWAVSWRQAQRAAAAGGQAGAAERRSLARKFYLYLFIFAATLTVLFTSVWLAYLGVSFLLGEPLPADAANQVAHALAYGLIAVAIWLYNGRALGRDTRLARSDTFARPDGPPSVAVVDGGEGRLGCMVLEALRRDLPGVPLLPLGLGEQARAAMGAPAEDTADAALQQAGVVVVPWQYAAGGTAAALGSSPARKVLLRAPAPGWEWAGEAPPGEADLVRQAVQAVQQILAGEQAGVRPGPNSLLLVLFTIAGLVVLVPVVFSILMAIAGG